MRVFLAGGSGVIGVRLIPLLVAAGHVVAATTRSHQKAAVLDDLGATPVVLDVFDAVAVRAAVVGFGTEAVLHELTSLPDAPTEIGAHTAANARIRREGTANLLAAATAAEARRFLAQSVAWALPGDSGAAVADLESSVLGWGGVVLRYGQFYGPGTYHPNEPPAPPRVHIDAAARLTVAALEHEPGIVEIVDE